MSAAFGGGGGGGDLIVVVPERLFPGWVGGLGTISASVPELKDFFLYLIIECTIWSYEKLIIYSDKHQKDIYLGKHRI